MSYRVVDEYGQVQPHGTALVDANGNYSFVVRLPSSRLGQDKDGRQYTIIVTATDEAGNTGSATTFVAVPHDQGNHEGNSQSTGTDTQDNGGKHKSNHDHGKSNRGNTGAVVIVTPGQTGGGNQNGNHGHGNNGNGNGNNDDGNGNHGHGNSGGHGHG